VVLEANKSISRCSGKEMVKSLLFLFFISQKDYRCREMKALKESEEMEPFFFFFGPQEIEGLNWILPRSSYYPLAS
jgi:hypothetical protein